MPIQAKILILSKTNLCNKKKYEIKLCQLYLNK